MRRVILPLPQYVFMAWCLVKQRDNFTFYLFIRIRVYPKVSGLAAWSENYKWYSSLPLGEIVLLFCESV
jgi:hypothetical protein